MKEVGVKCGFLFFSVPPDGAGRPVRAAGVAAVRVRSGSR
jgi:hypothetical protein